MANEQVNVPSLVVILVVSGLIIRFLFFSSASTTASSSGNASQRTAAASTAAARSREAAAERILQMFPQVDRRTVLWDLQRNGGSIAATTERILAGRMETPPVTFQPPPPPPSTASSATAAQTSKTAEKPAQPDLITRYNLKDKLATPTKDEEWTPAAPSKDKAWSSNKEERQKLLQKRRDQMVLDARRKMEAKIAAERAQGKTS